ncbi:efflux RND transporter permease subunit [bacterium]|nr:efflux RND transporter permease subunit [bacterium]
MKGPIAYMANNHVASNILMLVLVVGGLVMAGSIKQEVFPEFSLDMITVTVAYPGATPSEVEASIIEPLEFAVSGINNIKKVIGSANESVGVLTIEVIENEDADLVLQDVKSEVDRITTLPEEAEEPVISKVVVRREVITILVYGEADERALVEQAERAREDMLSYDNITQIDIFGARPYEISIEIPEENLRKYNLTLDRVAQKIRAASIDLAGGTIRDDGGDILIRTNERKYYGSQYDSIAVFSLPSGDEVLLTDIAIVNDDFAEVDFEMLFDGRPAVGLKVYRVGSQTPKGVSESVHEYVEKRNQELPPSIRLATVNDWSVILQSRMDLLVKNGLLGYLLVLIILALFLELRLAFWVASGILISFAGAFLFLEGLGITINMISLFGFLIIIGIVVDDAIIVGENIHVHIRSGKPLHRAAIDGAREMSAPVTFAILTTVAAFTPLLFLGGMMGKFMGSVPKIVILVLLISLIEALFILPAHLSGKLMKSKARIWQRLESKRAPFDNFVRWLIENTYAGTLDLAVRNRYATVAIGIAALLIVVGLFGGGFVHFEFMPEVEADEIVASLQMPPGTPFSETWAIAAHIRQIGEDLVKEFDGERKDDNSNLKHTISLVGQTSEGRGPHAQDAVFASNLAEVRLLLSDVDTRTMETSTLTSMWRDRVGEIPGAESLSFSSDLMGGNPDIMLQLSHTDEASLYAAVERLKNAMSSYHGVKEVKDSQSEGKRELKLKLRPEAQSLGITESDLAMQVRSAFFGAEALRVQRGQNEVKIMVRYPEKDLRALATIDNMRIRTTSGKEVPFELAAYIEDGRGFSTITRTDRKRVVNVSAKIDKEQANASEILENLESGELQDLMRDFPGLTYAYEGRSNDQAESMADLKKSLFFVLLLIYSILAVPFRSFTQPLVVMSAIPFGLVGAIVGHMIMGYNLSMISLMGFVALSGVVVNDSLVMIDFVNRSRAEGMSLREAVMEAGKRRFRPIILTSLTTFFGLMPMILETSFQARFLIPMAIGLGFGVLFATGITLLLIPSLYIIQEDILGLFSRKESGEPVADEAVQHV